MKNKFLKQMLLASLTLFLATLAPANTNEKIKFKGVEHVLATLILDSNDANMKIVAKAIYKMDAVNPELIDLFALRLSQMPTAKSDPEVDRAAWIMKSLAKHGSQRHLFSLENQLPPKGVPLKKWRPYFSQKLLTFSRKTSEQLKNKLDTSQLRININDLPNLKQQLQRFQSKSNKGNFAQIKEGMPIADVLDILGPPLNSVVSNAFIHTSTTPYSFTVHHFELRLVYQALGQINFKTEGSSLWSVSRIYNDSRLNSAFLQTPENYSTIDLLYAKGAVALVTLEHLNASQLTAAHLKVITERAYYMSKRPSRMESQYLKKINAILQESNQPEYQEAIRWITYHTSKRSKKSKFKPLESHVNGVKQVLPGGYFLSYTITNPFEEYNKIETELFNWQKTNNLSALISAIDSEYLDLKLRALKQIAKHDIEDLVILEALKNELKKSSFFNTTHYQKVYNYMLKVIDNMK